MKEQSEHRNQGEDLLKAGSWQEHLIFFALLGEERNKEPEDIFSDPYRPEFHQFSIPRKNSSAMLFIHLTPQKNVRPS
jgi:hypothetical protein